MARKNRTSKEIELQDYRHDTATRKNNPPAGIASHGVVRETPKRQYAYNPHLPPVLRFDETGESDQLTELLEKAQHEKLTAAEVEQLADALQNHAPWLEWAGKRGTDTFAVEPVALHVHERISAKAMLRIAAREDVQRDLFADPEQEYREAVQFYQHDIDWSNRLILGDSLTVMSSLAHREDLAGKVQMIYIDPPYGIKFSSNFQPTVFQRDVKDRAADLTREPEQIKAYRDTWTLGIHSYLAYLRDRLIVARDLLTDSGSIFVQIGEENVHRVRCLLDEVFGIDNFVKQINYRSLNPLGQSGLASVCDYVLWYAREKNSMKFRPLFVERGLEDEPEFCFLDQGDGTYQKLSKEEIQKLSDTERSKVFKRSALVSSGYTPSCTFYFEFQGQRYAPLTKRSWRTNFEGMERLKKSDRTIVLGKNPYFRQFYSDFPKMQMKNIWSDTAAGFSDPKIYVVQTNSKIVTRCLLMTTDPGDLVLDPTCGSGTTAYVAESWGRRWVAIDTSRVAVALARQRLLTATFDYYRLKAESKGVCGGFINKTVPHITLRSIAQNTALDPIFAKYEPILAEKLDALNRALETVTPEIRTKLLTKLSDKTKREGKRSITDADRRRWELPMTEWKEWEVPFDTDPDWHPTLQAALTDYRATWRAKMDEVNACIAASSSGEELVDQPETDRKRLRVSGPFTVEAVQPAEESLDENVRSGAEEARSGAMDRAEDRAMNRPTTNATIGDESPDDTLETFPADADESPNAEAYLQQMRGLLKTDGVRFPEGRTTAFATLDPLDGDILHAEGTWADDPDERLVAVAFGPQHGPVTAMQVEDCLRIASRRGYDDLIFAGFSFDAAAHAAIQDDPNPRVRVHIAHINPDVAMGDLLKETPTSQLFTVFGLPRTALQPTPDGNYTVTMEGVDIYNPVDNTVSSAGADKVAAWFLDTDYDGRTFCITQAFFPDKRAWSKIARALKGVIDENRFEKFSGTESLPFPVGEHRRVAVKVIDPRGNEVMRVHDLRRGYSP